jgi:hypothetical protein
MSHRGEDSTKVFVGLGKLPGKIPRILPGFQEGHEGTLQPHFKAEQYFVKEKASRGSSHFCDILKG